MQNIWKKNTKLMLILLLDIFIISGATYAATTMYQSNIVGYDNTTSGLNSTNVQGALDEVYSAATNYAAYNTRLEDVEDLIRANAGFHNSIFRGEDVSKYMPSSIVNGGDGSIYDRIAGTNGYSLFEDLYVGDYIVANNVNATVNGLTWRIAGFDVYYLHGNQALTEHHAVIVPDELLGSAVMNDSNTASGGYVGSKMYTTTLPSVLSTYITPVFNSHVLSHATLLTRGIGTTLYNKRGTNTGASNAWEWKSDKINLMNEVQITGNAAISSNFFDVSSDTSQFPLFRLRPEFKIAYNNTTHSTSARTWYWLRTIVTAYEFAYFNFYIDCADANTSMGIRPYFYIG